MKRFLFICILAAVSAASCNQKEPGERTILGMGTDYSSIPETLNGKLKSVRETNYWAVEKNGEFTRGDPMTWKDLDSVNCTKNFIVYFDENGALKQIDHFDVNNVIHDSSKGLAENGKYTSWNYESMGDDDSHLKVFYDNLGFISGIERYNLNDSLLNKQVLTHDGKGNYTGLGLWDSKGNKLYNQVYLLNEKEKVISTEVYDAKDSLLFKSTTEYDKDGRFIKQSSNSVWDMNYLKFDKKGNWTEVVAIIDNGKFRIFSEREYEYY